MSSWSIKASTASLSPFTTEKTPGGRPASMNHSAMSMDAEGSLSDGLQMKVFPQAMAVANIQAGTMAGKLNGVMPATTPRGWRRLYTSIPSDTCSLISPLRWCAIPHANSTFSSPRATSPAASDTTLPCSPLITRASSSVRAAKSSRKRNMIWVRWVRELSAHWTAAVLAAATAS